MSTSKRGLGATPKRIFGGYGPLLALVVAFLLIVTMVPTIAREQLFAGRTSAEQAPGAVAGSGGAGGTAVAGAPGSPVAGATTAAGRAVRASATGTAADPQKAT